jgi:chromosome segregation ATPase
MQRVLAGIVVLGLALVALPACKKSVEGESKRWSSTTQRVQELQALYPGFVAPLKEQLKKAEAVMEAAKGLSDEQAKIKKMAEANSAALEGFAGQLGSVERLQKQIREKITTATTGVTDKNDRFAAKQAADDAQRVMRLADETLKTGATEIVGANAIVRKVESDLSTADRNLDRVIDAAKAKQKAATTKTPEAKGGTTPAAGPAAPARWKCSYCSNSNDPTAAKCTNCGAARP